MVRLLVAAVVAAGVLIGYADEEPAGETLGEFCYQTRTGVVVTVDVAASAERVLDAMPYGRGSGTKIVKTGVGKLVIKDLRNYPGQVIVEAGAIRLGDIDEPAGESEVCDIQNLSLADGTEVEVAAGKTARIAIADFSVRFTKSGGGTLEVVNTENKKLVNVTLAGGNIVYVNEPTISALAEMAAGPSLHLDANDTNKMTFASAGSMTVSKWYDAKGVNFAEKKSGSPTLVIGATTNTLTQTPLNAVSFGGFRSQSRASLDAAVHGARTVFVVAAKGGDNQIGMLLGTSPQWCLDPSTSPDTSKDIADFKYGTDNNGWPNSAFKVDSGNYTVRYNCGKTYYYWDGAEGETPSGSTEIPSNIPAPTSTQNFILHEVRLPVGAHVSALAGWGANYLHSGGWRYGEILIYERALTDRERIATRNYLAKKWLGRTDAELTALPDAPADPDPFVVPEFRAKDGGSLIIGTGDNLIVKRFSGAGTFTKDGAGTLAVQDFVGYTGTVSVAAGTLKLTGVRPTYEPVDPAALKPALHFDASDAASFTYISEADRTVSAWASKNGAGVSAQRKTNCLGGNIAVKTSESLGGKDYVDFVNYTGAHFRDDATGVTNSYNVKTMITLVGSQRGGGMLMGGTDNKDPFFRGPNHGGAASDPILWSGTSSTEPTRRGEFYLNFERLANELSSYGHEGVRDPAVVGLSGGWDVVGFRASADTTDPAYQAICQGLAFESVPGHYRDGKQNLAEIAVWTNVITAAEVQGMGAYLKVKWNQEPTWERSRVNGLTLDVAEGATLDLDGKTQYLESLSGAGTVANGMLALGQISLDAAHAQTMPVGLDLSSTKTITVANVLSAPLGKTTLLTAPSVVGALDGVVIVGLSTLPATVEATLAVEGNALVLALAQKEYVKVLEPADGSSVPVVATCTTAVDYVVGEGVFTKTGAGMLATKDIVGYTGTVTVAEGTLKLTGVLPKYEPAMPDATDLALHVDASDLSTLTLTNGGVSGRAYIKEWRSKTPNGWKVVPRVADYKGTKPYLAADADLNGQQTVRMQDNSSYGMQFVDAAGNRVGSTNVMSVLWILGSQEGGGFLMGQELAYGAKTANGWHRGEPSFGNGNANAKIFYSSAYDGLRTAEMYLNDLRLSDSGNWPKGKASATPQNTGLSGKWDFISLRVWSGYARTVAADGFAFHTENSYSRTGCQRLAEVLLYERQLTEEEAFQAGAALRVKWGLEPTWQRSQTNAFGIAVAAGATLDLGGTNQFVKTLGGAGTVVNGTVLAEALAFDATAAGLQVAATLDLTATKRISLVGVASAPLGATTLLTATEVVGTLDGITVTGLAEGMPQTRTATVALVDNALVLTVAQTSWMKTLTPADGSTVLVPSETTTADFVVGEGAFTKGGAGTLAIKDLVGYTGTVTVAEGTLKLTGVLPPVEPAMPGASNCVMHLDASVADSLTLVEYSGTQRVSEWRSQTPNGWKVTPTATSTQYYPRFSADADLAYDAPSVRIPNSNGMWFRDADGNKVMTTNILSAIWILGSQEGGGFLLGLSEEHNSKKSHFFRGANGGDYGSKASDYIFYSGACDGARTMEMYVNDLHLSGSGGWPCGILPDTPQNTGLSGKYDYIFGRVQEWNYRNKVAADSLAYDPITASRSGHQRLAELLIFERVLNAAEERAASAYLRVKWGLEPTWQRSQTNAFGVSVAKDATLDLNGTNAYLRAVGGAGSVINGNVTTAGLIASGDGTLTVEGTVTATSGFTVDLRGLSEELMGEITILTATGGIVNKAAVKAATIIGDNYPNARVFVKGNSVIVRLRRHGFMLIAR